MKATAIDVSDLESVLGHRFVHREVLERALTHSSYAREAESQGVAEESSARDNEQLEFLGDAVLSFVVSQELFRQFPHFEEGDLSKLRAHIVSARALNRPARELRIGEYLRLGKGEEKSGGRSKSALLVNALEALIAALFLDAGPEAAHRFITTVILRPALEELRQSGNNTLPVSDFKSALQEMAHSLGRSQPRYELVRERGPDHRKVFTVEVHVPGSTLGPSFVRRADGSTKKRAEQAAARRAWEYLQLLHAGNKTGKTESEVEPPNQYE